MVEEIKPILTVIKDNFLSLHDTGNVTVWNKKYEKEFTRKNTSKSKVTQIGQGCCMNLYSNFQRHNKIDDKLVFGLFHSPIGYDYQYSHLLNDCYFEMIVNLKNKTFVNPLKAKYTDIEYINTYITLLQKMGLLCYVSSFDDNLVVIRVDYESLQYTEKNYLLLNWQAVRNLHLGYTMHVPARFIELSELYPEEDLFLLFRLAYRFIPSNCITSSIGPHSINNYNPFVLNSGGILFYNINLEINSSNLRETLVRSKKFSTDYELATVLGVINKDSYFKYENTQDYINIYNKLVNSTSKEELWSNIQEFILKNKQNELKTNKTEETCQIS